MESLTTAEAAQRAGLTVRQWHYWAAKAKVRPVRQLTGLRGPKFWSAKAVESVTAEIEEAAA
jgi:hypothetical protein